MAATGDGIAAQRAALVEMLARKAALRNNFATQIVEEICNLAGVLGGVKPKPLALVDLLRGTLVQVLVRTAAREESEEAPSFPEFCTDQGEVKLMSNAYLVHPGSPLLSLSEPLCLSLWPKCNA